MISRAQLITLLVVVSLVGIGASPGTQPSNDPAAVKATLKAFYAAMAAGDRDAIVTQIHAADAPHKAMAESFADLVSLHVKLRNAITKKFGADALADFPDPAAPTAAEIDAASVQVTGDKAEAQLSNGSGRAVKDGGDWKVAALDDFNADMAQQVTKAMAAAIDGAKQACADVSAGRITTLADAKALLNKYPLPFSVSTR
jgi:hypothetical protein